MKRNRHPPDPGQLDLPLHDPPPEPEGRPAEPTLPRGWRPVATVVVDVELERRRPRDGKARRIGEDPAGRG